MPIEQGKGARFGVVYVYYYIRVCTKKSSEEGI